MLQWGSYRELLRAREKGVLRAARPRTPFQGEYPRESILQSHYKHYRQQFTNEGSRQILLNN